MTTPPDDLIPITEAAILLRRSVYTVRRWTDRGFAPSGANLRCWRDHATLIRWYSRRDVVRVRGTMVREGASR